MLGASDASQFDAAMLDKVKTATRPNVETTGVPMTTSPSE